MMAYGLQKMWSVWLLPSILTAPLYTFEKVSPCVLNRHRALTRLPTKMLPYMPPPGVLFSQGLCDQCERAKSIISYSSVTITSITVDHCPYKLAGYAGHDTKYEMLHLIQRRRTHHCHYGHVCIFCVVASGCCDHSHISDMPFVKIDKSLKKGRLLDGGCLSCVETRGPMRGLD
jgi:hypothetical protein